MRSLQARLNVLRRSGRDKTCPNVLDIPGIREIEMEILAMIVPPNLPSTKTGWMISFPTYKRVIAHWRAIILLLILARVAFLVASSDEFVSFELNLFA